MKIKKYIHSTFEIETSGSRILVDLGNFASEKGIEQFGKITNLMISHRHPDHFDKTGIVSLIQRDNPKIIATQDVIEALGRPAIVATIDSVIELTPELTATPVLADHRKDLPYNVGYVINNGKLSIYYAGDTFPVPVNGKHDVALLPIGGMGFTMDPESAVQFAKNLQTGLVIPIHYEHPKMNVNLEKFKEMCQSEGIRAKILSKNETIQLPEYFASILQAATKGRTAQQGRISGFARAINDYPDLELVEKGEIMVAYKTEMDFTPYMLRCRGIATQEGGITSHAALFGREHSIPTIVGAENLMGKIQTGDYIMLNNGEIMK